jgi:iron-sulfur cluster assembly accessory protein
VFEVLLSPWYNLNMATRTFVPTTTSSAAFFRALAIASSSRSCPHTLRTFSSTVSRKQSGKRELYTAPEYQSHSLSDFPPPPPRNTGIPDTSIAGPPSKNNNERPLKIIGEQESDHYANGTENASISVPEREAQKSKPVPQATSSIPEKKPRRSRLKARKAAMSITPSALLHLRELLEQPEPKMIRVGVKNRGCSGLAYHLEYVEKPGAFDEVVEQDGVKVLIDSKALFSIIGSEMDWLEDKLSTRFVFKNPNITEQCGCGESFSIS